MSLVTSKSLMGSGMPQGYLIQRSLRFRSSASAYLSRTPSSSTNRQISTFSAWVKFTGNGSTVYPTIFGAAPNGSTYRDAIYWNNQYISIIFSNVATLTTTQVFRDYSAWYHIVMAIDTTQATASNRIKLYVNGSQVTSFSTATYPSQNYNPNFNSAIVHNIGRSTDANDYLDGYLAEVNFIDGQALTPSSFGQTDAITGVWTPKKYTGTYGTNGFYLNFSDNTSATTLAYDKSGNSNNWTANNISTTAGVTYDSMTDVPTLTSATAANFCVMNPVASALNVGSITDGNLSVSTYTGNSLKLASFAQSSGKWYWEVTVTGGLSTGPDNGVIGIMNSSLPNTSSAFGTTGIIMYYGANGNKYVNGTGSAYGASYTTNAVIGVALDMDGGTITFYKNNASQGSITISSITNAVPFLASGDGTAAIYYAANFGQRPFSYTPPTGFKALNTFNLPDPTIKKPNQYMDATLYTGNGSTQTITNAGGFQPDFVWTKTRVAVASPQLFDSVRGAYLSLRSNVTGAEANNNPYGVTAFNSNGFSVADIAAGDYGVNGGSGGLYSGTPPNYVAWQWKKGATPGFDIVTYTGNGTVQSVPHSLGVSPAFYIVKSRSVVVDWVVNHKSLTTNQYLVLNQTAAVQTAASVFNGGTRSATTFDVGVSSGASATTNQSSATYVAYLFAEIAGFSKFGSYTGNGSADGPFVYCGFRPKYVMIKYASGGSQGTASWYVHDTSRSAYNQSSNDLSPNLSSAEPIGTVIDIVSNGFKIRGSGGGTNGGGGETYIYAAFAENPFKYSLAR